MFYSQTDNKLFENADTAKSRVVQLEIHVAQLQQVGMLNSCPIVIYYSNTFLK